MSRRRAGRIVLARIVCVPTVFIGSSHSPQARLHREDPRGVRRPRAVQQGVCQCRRSSRPPMPSAGHATMCGVPGATSCWHPGHRKDLLEPAPVTRRTNHSPSLWDSRRSTPPMARSRSSSVPSRRRRLGRDMAQGYAGVMAAPRTERRIVGVDTPTILRSVATSGVRRTCGTRVPPCGRGSRR